MKEMCVKCAEKCPRGNAVHTCLVFTYVIIAGGGGERDHKEVPLENQFNLTRTVWRFSFGSSFTETEGGDHEATLL